MLRIPSPAASRHGFTLVELSIVLAIIGLLIGGVLAGQNLLRGAELKAILTDFNRYKTATDQFKNQYGGLPGDLLDATEYWGQAAAGVSCATTVGTGTATCNGNGDNRIASISGSDEELRYWQHLVNAGLLGGSFNGVPANGTAGSHASDRSNAPAGKMTNSFWFSWSWINVAGDPSLFDGTYGHSFSYGRLNPGSWPSNPLLEPDDAYGIDRKIDDGKPGLGSVLAAGWDNCTTAANSSATNADYALQDSNIHCILIFANVTR